MSKIQIIDAQLPTGRPRTLLIRGYIDSFPFYAELLSVNLNITSSHLLSDKLVQEFENKLKKVIFPLPYSGKFDQKEIDEVMEESPIIFTV